MRRGLDATKVAPGAQRTPPGWIRDEVRTPEEGACAVCRSPLYVGDTYYRDGAGAAVWFFGPWGWVLDMEWIARPVTARGAQGCWLLPESVERQVVDQLIPNGVPSPPRCGRAG